LALIRSSDVESYQQYIENKEPDDHTGHITLPDAPPRSEIREAGSIAIFNMAE
jgi:hypothetical protein